MKKPCRYLVPDGSYCMSMGRCNYRIWANHTSICNNKQELKRATERNKQGRGK